MNLSKSRYCSAVQCLKMLWLKQNKPEEFDESAINDAVLKTGNEAGDIAMGLFGDFTEVPYSTNLQEMIDKTKALMDCGTPVIAEASFAYDGAFCSVDILKNLGNGAVEVYEVKSSTDVKDIYRHDLSFQCYVLRKLGYDVKKACLVHINNSYVRQGELDLQQLFTVEDMTELVAGMDPGVERRINTIREYMQNLEEDLPEMIGLHCFNPYNCGFFKYCTKDLPKPNIFDVASLRKDKKFKCYYECIISFEEIWNSGAITGNHMKQVEFEVKELPPEIDIPRIREFLDTLSYPLYFLDFESFQPAVPLYDNSRPYEQIVFQYSLHYIEEQGGQLKHKEYLAYPGKDPRRALAEQLCADIPLDVYTMAYSMSFEKMIIKGLAELYPDLKEHLMNIHGNMVDLMVPFQKKHYYSREMQGSYSIKKVLPALFPDDPALDYSNLEGVHNGGEASATFAAMATMNPAELEKWRKHLLEYCKLDTLAMVKIWKKLKEVAYAKIPESSILTKTKIRTVQRTLNSLVDKIYFRRVKTV